MNKILALDIGDQWIGIAISDILHIVARPYKTVTIKELTKSLEEIIKSERIKTIVVGYPKTMKGGESDQTKKVLAHLQILKDNFPDITFTLWDERLSSKRAEQTKKARTQEQKTQSHALAAAFILDSYLHFLSAQQESHNTLS